MFNYSFYCTRKKFSCWNNPRSQEQFISPPFSETFNSAITFSLFHKDGTKRYCILVYVKMLDAIIILNLRENSRRRNGWRRHGGIKRTEFFLWILLCFCIAKLPLTSIKHTSGNNECIETSQREKSQLQYIWNISLLRMFKIIHHMQRFLKRHSLSRSMGIEEERVHTMPFFKRFSIC